MTRYFVSPFTGEEISIKTPETKAGIFRYKHKWACPLCDYRWKGHKRLYKEGRKPNKCPRCQREITVLQVEDQW